MRAIALLVFLSVLIASTVAARATAADRDGDGIADAIDRCPDDAEDRDGIQDEDGCPEGDADQDGIPDVADACPLARENYNGIRDDDGCPDRCDPPIERTRWTVLPTLVFPRGARSVPPAFAPILDELAATMRARSDVERAEIVGHASVDERAPGSLGLARAQAVRDALVHRGIPPERIVVVSRGASSPVDPRRTKAARSSNRRVEIHEADPPSVAP